jgi:hypothetical protein
MFEKIEMKISLFLHLHLHRIRNLDEMSKAFSAADSSPAVERPSDFKANFSSDSNAAKNYSAIDFSGFLTI